jgi:ABC-type sugar transport system, periplasmic component
MKKIIIAVLCLVLIFSLIIPISAFTSVSVKNIRLESDKINLTVGETYQLKVLFTPANATNKKLAYSSSDKNIISVDTNGKVKAVKAGSATVKITSAYKKSISVKVTFTVKEKAKAFSFTKYSQPVKLTFHATVGSDAKFRESQGIDNNAFTQWAKNELGIIWSTKFVSPTNEDGKTKLNLLMASGDLPDAIFAETPQMGVLYNAGELLPLNNLIEKYGSPLLKERIKAAQQASNGTFFSSYTSKGTIYAMPIDADLWGRTYYNTFLRQDILAKLGKQVPQTLAQFEDVLAAYKAKYPDGVGVFMYKDMVPNAVNQMSPAMQPYGAYPGRWVKASNGKLVYGSIQPETKKGLATLAKWYKNGWIDKEFIVKDFNKEAELYSAGKVLSITGDWWYPYWPFPDTVKNNPDAEFSATSLKGPDGKVKLIGGNPFSYAIAISVGCKHPEAFIYQLNEMVDSTLRNDLSLRSGMKKDYNYDFKYPVEADSAKQPLNPNDSAELQNFVVKRAGPGYYATNIEGKYTAGFEFTGEVDLSYLNIGKVADALKKNDDSSLNTEWKNAFNTIKNVNKTHSAIISEMTLAKTIRNNLYFDGYLGAPTPTMVEKNAYLLKLENEAFAKIIMGTGASNEFEKFVAEWKKAGGDKITSEVNN